MLKLTTQKKTTIENTFTQVKNGLEHWLQGQKSNFLHRLLTNLKSIGSLSPTFKTYFLDVAPDELIDFMKSKKNI